ncbi:MAG: glycosyltransferase family 39 protein, partial [Elusimicrobiota bacterium]
MGRNKGKQKEPVSDPIRWHRRPETLIFFAALSVSFLHLWIFRGDFWLKTALLDDQMFQSAADVILREGWIAKSLGIFDLNPAYPYFLAAMGKTFGMGYGVVFSLQHIAGALIPVGFYLLGLRAFGRKSGLAAAAIGALFGPAIFYESRFLGEFWIYFFNLASLLALVYAHERERPELGWALSGLALGLSTIFRPNVLVFLPFVAVWGVHSLRARPKRMAACAALYLLALWLPLLPFQLRNRAVDPTRGWGLTTSSGGINLYLGNNPEADGLNQAPSFVRYGPGHQFEDFKKEAE